ncbi:MAG: hypothetical protein QMC74_00905 [Myxococcota bacterium]|jgi:hypothetical protein
MANFRWIVAAGALLVAVVAFYVLLNVGGVGSSSSAVSTGGTVSSGGAQPALDDIDAESRAAMRDLLREAGRED